MADGREFRIGAVFGKTGRVLRSLPATFLLIALIPVPVAGIFALILGSIVDGATEDGSLQLFCPLSALVVEYFFVLSAFMLARAMITCCAFEVCYGRNVDVRAAAKLALRRAWWLVGLACLTLIWCIGWFGSLRVLDRDFSTIVAMLVAVAVGASFQADRFVATPVAILENAGMKAGIVRRVALTNGHRWRILGILAVCSSAIVGAPLITAVAAGMPDTPVRLHDVVLLSVAAASMFSGVEVAMMATVGLGILVVLGYSGLLIAGYLVLFVVPATLFMWVLATVTYADLRQAEERRGSEGDEIARVFD